MHGLNPDVRIAIPVAEGQEALGLSLIEVCSKLVSHLNYGGALFGLQ